MVWENVSNVLRHRPLTCTHCDVLFVGTIFFVLLLSRKDVLDLTDTLATSGSVWSIPLSGGEVLKSANFTTSSAFEFHFGRASAVLSPSLAPLFFIRYMASFWRFLANVERGRRHEHLLHQTLDNISVSRKRLVPCGRTLEAESERFCSLEVESVCFCGLRPCCRAMTRIWSLSVSRRHTRVEDTSEFHRWWWVQYAGRVATEMQGDLTR
jgi:hypothetical protein